MLLLNDADPFAAISQQSNTLDLIRTLEGTIKAGVKKSPGKDGISMTARIKDKLQTYIRCNTFHAWDTFENVNVSPDLNI